MNYLATLLRPIVALLVLGFPALVTAQSIHMTGTVDLEVFDTGVIGTHDDAPATGFVFGGLNGLYEGQLLVALDDMTVSGDPYDPPLNVTTTPIAGAATTYPDFDDAFESAYDIFDRDGTDMGLNVTQLSQSDNDAPNAGFVVLDFTVENTSGGALTGIYVGIFADMDVGDFLLNFADYDAATQTAYVWEDGGATNPNYYGVTLPLDVTSGWDDSAGTLTEAEQFADMTTLGTPAGAVDDRRLVLATGPIDLADAETRTVTFCFVAGADEADLLDNAAACVTAVMPVAIEPGPDGLPGTHNLSAVYPNPFNPQANFTLEVAEQQSVRIAVYDALGREVATLFNGTLTAGTEHAFTFDGAGLPSGVYMVRATGEQFTDVRRVTLMK